MYHRRAAGRAVLMAIPLLLQALLSSFPYRRRWQRGRRQILPASSRPVSSSPSAAERPGLKGGPHEEPEYRSPNAEDEPGELQKD